MELTLYATLWQREMVAIQSSKSIKNKFFSTYLSYPNEVPLHFNIQPQPRA